MTKHFIYILLLLCSSTLMVAQNNAIFNGGSTDGHTKNCYAQPSNLNTTLSKGGNGDGHSKDCYVQTSNLNLALSKGGNGDGHSKDCYTQTSNLNTTLSAGGNGDGSAKDCYTQSPVLTVNFNGGSNDGYAKDCYTQASNLNPIFSGGVGGDGQLNGCANEPLGCFLAINLGNDTTFCDGQTLTLNAGVFPGGATYEWQDSSSAQTFLVDTTGIYYVFVTDTAGCTGIDSIVVTVNPMPTVDLGNDTAFCAGNNLILDAGNAGATYLWQNNPIPAYQNQTLTVNSTGIYFVTASFGTCTDTDSITVTVNPIVTTNLPDSIICQGDSALIFGVYQSVAGTYRDTILASTGCDSILVQQLNVNPTYNQNLGTVTICQGDSALILGNYETVAGIYSNIYQSINGCDSIVSQTLNVSPIHVVNLGNDTVFCAGNSLTLNASAGAGSYQWINGVGFPYNQQTYTVSSTGTYYVVTTLGACTTSDTINVTVHPIVTTNLTNEVVCQGDSALIFGTYQTIAGNYYDTLTASTGCDSILVKQLVVNPTYNQNLGTVTICSGDSALIFGNYETVAGTYSDTLISINSCDSIVNQTLSVLSNSSVNLGNDTTFCAGNSLLLDAGSGNSYLWQDGFTSTQTYLVTSSGLYYVTVSLGACSATDSINIIVNPIVTTNLTNEVVCQGDSVLIFGSYQTVSGNYYDTLTASTGCDSILLKQLIVNPTYNQNLGTVNICQGDSALILGNYETVAGTYSDTLTSINGCDSIVSQTLNIDTTPVVTLGNDTTFCSGNSLILDAGAGATSYQWMSGSTSGFLQQTFTVNVTGTYYVTATIGVCSATDSIDVTVIQPIYTNLTNLSVCQGDSSLIFGDYQTIAGNYYDTLMATSTSCDSILVQQLIVNPTISTNTTATICNGDSILLGGAYQNTSGVYTDVYTSSLGCDSIITTTLSVINGFTTNWADTICEGESLFVGGAFQIVTGIYYDSLQAANGCDSLVITNLLVSPKPTVIATASPSYIVAGESAQLNATGGGTYQWSPLNNLTCGTCANPVASPLETTIYTVTVDSNGCIASDTTLVEVDDEFFIPEGFSPNGDGVNDLFEIVGIAKYPNNNIIIINRWGNKVFEAAPYKSDWDGTSQFGVKFGEKLPTGTYFYILDLGKENPSGKQEIKGYIYINR